MKLAIADFFQETESQKNRGYKWHCILVKFSWNGRSRGSKPSDIASIFWALQNLILRLTIRTRLQTLRRDATPLSTLRSSRGIAFSSGDGVPRYSFGFSLTRVTGSWFILGTRAGTCHNICIIRELASSIFIFRNVHGVLNFISRLFPRPVLLLRLSSLC